MILRVPEAPGPMGKLREKGNKEWVGDESENRGHIEGKDVITEGFQWEEGGSGSPYRPGSESSQGV